MPSTQYIKQLNGTNICAKRAECTETGQNIDTALSSITSNTLRVTGGTGISITENPLTISSTVPTGSTGPQGFCGPKGFCGPSGSIGARGDTGLQGFCGPSGVRGPIGTTGPQGFCGPSGIQWNPTSATVSSYPSSYTYFTITGQYQQVLTSSSSDSYSILNIFSYANSSYTSAFSVMYKWASSDGQDVHEVTVQYRYNVYEFTIPFMQIPGKAYTLQVRGVAGTNYGTIGIKETKFRLYNVNR